MLFNCIIQIIFLEPLKINSLSFVQRFKILPTIKFIYMKKAVKNNFFLEKLCKGRIQNLICDFKKKFNDKQ